MGSASTNASAVVYGGHGMSLGAAVAVADLNGGAAEDILVGAPMHNVPGVGTNTGAVYVYFDGLSGDVDADAADLVITGIDRGDQLGTAISGDGDIDGDGEQDLVPGAVRGAASGAVRGA